MYYQSSLLSFIDLCCSISITLSTIISLSSISNQQCKYNALYKTQVDLASEISNWLNLWVDWLVQKSGMHIQIMASCYHHTCEEAMWHALYMFYLLLISENVSLNICPIASSANLSMLIWGVHTNHTVWRKAINYERSKLWEHVSLQQHVHHPSESPSEESLGLATSPQLVSSGRC